MHKKSELKSELLMHFQNENFYKNGNAVIILMAVNKTTSTLQIHRQMKTNAILIRNLTTVRSCTCHVTVVTPRNLSDYHSSGIGFQILQISLPLVQE